MLTSEITSWCWSMEPTFGCTKRVGGGMGGSATSSMGSVSAGRLDWAFCLRILCGYTFYSPVASGQT